jgi:methylated-DNA-protein-cysteine methyltransferase related protein
MKEKVYEIVSKIPKGKVMTYGQVAELSGNQKASRAVGNILNMNADPKNIPCHRVVRSDGAISGYAFGGGEVKMKKLKKEGVEFKGNKVNLGISQI